MATKALPYPQEKEAIKKFFQEYSSQDTTQYPTTFKYLEQLQKIANRQISQLIVDVDDVHEYGDSTLASSIQENTLRYQTLFAEVVDEIKPEPSVTTLPDETVLDVFIHHRDVLQQNALENAPSEAQRPRYPKQLQRRHEVVFRPSSTEKPRSVRQVDARFIGRLVRVEGIVIRATAVKPSVTIATYACDQCGCEIYQEVTAPQFMPMTVCNSKECEINRRKGQLHLQTRGSKFEKFQELRIQEMARHVPTGHIPRSMTVLARGETTREASPGDHVTVSGIFLPVPYAGFKQIRAGLLSDTYLEAQIIDKEKRAHTEHVLTDEMREEIEQQAQDSERIYERLSSSISPHIYGHDDVKKALLLLLVGGIDRKMNDGMKIRGDINICLMGDPGVAKSQMLKAVADLAPRGVYTTGRGSSGVGLTAAVTRDPLTNELVLEGGALVLADMGVCCIDEFDKMMEGDRTSIHEVMEQQTISIAKAGITTSLNARASILAAANPLYGRYNPKKSATQNINLPAALLSRFDLVFLLLDRPDLDADLRLAQHITYVHTHNDFPPLEYEPLEKEFVRNYVSVAKSYQPHISSDLTEYIVGVYCNMRSEAEQNQETMTFTSARTLLAILRLASALARLRFSAQVVQADVDEALRLMEMSKASLQDVKDSNKNKKSPIAEIFSIIKQMIKNRGSNQISMADARQQVLSKGFKPDQFEAMLNEYEGDHNVLQVSADRARIIVTA